MRADLCSAAISLLQLDFLNHFPSSSRLPASFSLYMKAFRSICGRSFKLQRRDSNARLLLLLPSPSLIGAGEGVSVTVRSRRRRHSCFNYNRKSGIMDQWLPTLSSSDNRGLELHDVATEDSTIAIVIADATIDPFVEARETMNAAVDPHAITNAVVNDTATFFSSPVLVHGSVEAGSTSQRRTLFKALLNQIFTVVKFAKMLLVVNTSSIGFLLSIHGQSNISEVLMAIMTILIGSGFITLPTSLLLQDSYPEYAEPAALVGAFCVLAFTIIFLTVLFPTKVDPAVWISVALFLAFLWIATRKMREWHKRHND